MKRWGRTTGGKGEKYPEKDNRIGKMKWKMGCKIKGRTLPVGKENLGRNQTHRGKISWICDQCGQGQNDQTSAEDNGEGEGKAGTKWVVELTKHWTVTGMRAEGKRTGEINTNQLNCRSLTPEKGTVRQ